MQAFDCRVHSRSICFACERSFKCFNRAVHAVYCIVKLLQIFLVSCIFCPKGDIGSNLSVKVVGRGKVFIVKPAHKDLAVHGLGYGIRKVRVKQLDLFIGNVVSVDNRNEITGGQLYCLRFAVAVHDVGSFFNDADACAIPCVLCKDLAVRVSYALYRSAFCCDDVSCIGNKINKLIRPHKCTCRHGFGGLERKICSQFSYLGRVKGIGCVGADLLLAAGPVYKIVTVLGFGCQGSLAFFCRFARLDSATICNIDRGLYKRICTCYVFISCCFGINGNLITVLQLNLPCGCGAFRKGDGNAAVCFGHYDRTLVIDVAKIDRALIHGYHAGGFVVIR